MPDHYEIRVRDHLDLCWAEWFADLELTHLEGNETLASLSAAAMVLVSSIADVTGPVPPGTGVIAEAFSATASKSTSPTTTPRASASGRCDEI